MAEQKQENLSAADEEEVEEKDENEMTGGNTIPSQSAFETENLKALGESGHLIPDEARGVKFLLPEKYSMEPDGFHLVTCTFTVSLAVLAEPAGERQEGSNDPDTPGKRTQASNLGTRPKTQRCYHIEYFLLPDDLVPRKLDLVLVGLVAKLFTHSNSKTIRPWFENEKMWLSWKHSVDLRVTNEYLTKLRDHKIILRIWATKGKTSSKSRQRKMNIMSSLEGDAEAVDEVGQTVLLQRKLFEASQPRPSRTEIKAPEESEAQEESPALPVEAGAADLLGQARSGSDLSHSPQPEYLQNISELLGKIWSWDEAKKEADNMQSGRSGRDKPASMDGSKCSDLKRNPVAKSSVTASLQLDVMPLLAGERAVVTRLAEGSPEILDAYMTFTVEAPLMSERQRHELNPLVIRIKSATHLPNTPVPIEVLQRVCVPIYCRYKFHHFPPHQTQGQVHGTHVYFKDVNVLLTGTTDPGELQRYLIGPPLEIEVHDRDRKLDHNRAKPSLLEEGEADENVGEGSSLAGKPRRSNSCRRKEVWHPHGVAKVSLTDLLSGQKHLKIRAPILNSSPPSTAACSKSRSQHRRGAGSDSPSWLLAHYLESGSLLKVEVEVAVPLRKCAEMAEAPYACIIYTFDHNRSSLSHELVEEISAVNAEALQLHCSLLHFVTMDCAASRLKTTPEKVSEMDIVTGFHLLDGETHLFVLEGLKDKAIKRIWDRHFERLCYLSQSKSLRGVIRGDLLPSAKMITVFSHQYGVPLTWDNLNEVCMQEKEPGDTGASGRNCIAERQGRAVRVSGEAVLPRESWGWDRPHIDFDLCKKPPEFCAATAPRTGAAPIRRRPETRPRAQHCTAPELPVCGPRDSLEPQKLQGPLKDEPLPCHLRRAAPLLQRCRCCLHPNERPEA